MPGHGFTVKRVLNDDRLAGGKRRGHGLAQQDRRRRQPPTVRERWGAIEQATMGARASRKKMKRNLQRETK